VNIGIRSLMDLGTICPKLGRVVKSEKARTTT
jgi:hypothetical protein